MRLLFLALGAQSAKKLHQQRGGFFRQQTAEHLDPVVEPGMSQQVHHAAARARFGINCPINEPGEPGQDHRSRAHGARFERTVERHVFQPPMADHF